MPSFTAASLDFATDFGQLLIRVNLHEMQFLPDSMLINAP